jgi:thiamine kinase-like enzyme
MLLSSCIASKTQDIAAGVASNILHKDKRKLKIRRGKYSRTFFITEEKGEEETNYTLRIFSRKQSKESRELEVYHADLLSKIGAGPNLVGANELGHVMEQIEGKVLRKKDMKHKEVIEAVAFTLHTMHSNKSKFDAQSLVSEVEQIIKIIDKNGVPVPTVYIKECEKVCKMCRETQKKIETQEEKIGFCHNGLTLRNMILGKDKRVYIVNAYHAGNASIYDDLGCSMNSLNLNKEGCHTFLKAYFGREPTADELNFIKMAQKLGDIRDSAALFVRFGSRNDKEDSKEDKAKMFDTMVKSHDDNLNPTGVGDVETLLKSHDKKRAEALAVGLFMRSRGYFS